MNMIESHMEQIASSSAAISELPFPPPKIFANALLQPHDITALIRDTEVHERALFKAAPPEPGSFEPISRKSNWFESSADVTKGGTVFPGLKSNTAVGRILGGHVMEKIRRSDRADGDKSDIDIDALLNGAERLRSIYPVAGAAERIASMRERHEQLKSSIAHYESIVAKQTAQLDQANHVGYNEDDFTTGPLDKTSARISSGPVEHYGPEDFLREEAEMRELEQKKQNLEDRVSGIDKDLGGLLR